MELATTTKRVKGQHIEGLAKVYLERLGLQLITQNFTSKLGEIDLIMRHHQTLIFIEVRHRTTLYYGEPLETVTFYKQQKIIKTAQYFLIKHPQFRSLDCRFDIISAIGELKDLKWAWIKNAFGVQ